jgi:ribosome-binding protein aMBF1 (putative translation factor)
MVDTYKCELCGSEARYPTVKLIDGINLNFCCRGCLEVYEMMREEGLSNPPKAADNQSKNPGKEDHHKM